MKIKVDLIQTKQHLTFLENEKRELEDLTEAVNVWQNQILLSGMDAQNFIDMHQKTIGFLYESVLQRKAFLESFIERFTDISRITKNSLTDTFEELKHYVE